MDIRSNARGSVGQWVIHEKVQVLIMKKNDQDQLDIAIAEHNTEPHLLQLIQQIIEREIINNETPVEVSAFDYNDTIENLLINEDNITVGKVIRALEPVSTNRLSIQQLQGWGNQAWF